MRRSRNSQKLRWGTLTFLFLSLTGFIFLGLGGCSHNPVDVSTTSYDVDNGLRVLNFIDSLQASDSGGAEESGASASSVVVEDSWVLIDYECDIEEVDEEGEELSIELDDQDVLFVIPEGALTQEVEIEICGWKYSTPFGYAFVYECGPSGQQFNIPIQVIQYAEDDDGELAGMFYKGDGDDDWELEQISVIENGSVQFEIHHFSKYGISFR